jgi:hypothetical protein
MLINFACVSYIVSLHKINVEIHCLDEVIFLMKLKSGYVPYEVVHGMWTDMIYTQNLLNLDWFMDYASAVGI